LFIGYRIRGEKRMTLSGGACSAHPQDHRRDDGPPTPITGASIVSVAPLGRPRCARRLTGSPILPVPESSLHPSGPPSRRSQHLRSSR
jgi:hypothetical protein